MNNQSDIYEFIDQLFKLIYFNHSIFIRQVFYGYYQYWQVNF